MKRSVREWLPGGTFGLGTIICAFLVGPAASIFLPRNERSMEGVVTKAVNRRP